MSAVLKRAGGNTCSPCICCKNEVYAPGVHKQWPEGDIFKVQSAVNQFQPFRLGIDIRVTFHTIKRLRTGCEFVAWIETDQ